MILLLACTSPDPANTPAVGSDSEVRDSALAGDSADTGETGDSGGEPSACAATDLVEATLPAQVGSFTVAAGGFVEAAAEGRTLFEAKGLELAEAELHAEEHQGSFELSEEVGSRCAEPQIVSVRQATGGLLELGLAFDDCPDVQATWTFCEPDPGHLAFAIDSDADRITLAVARDADEKVFGLGEQFAHDTLDLVGREIPVIAQEGGVGRGHQPISAAVNAASPGSAGSEESTYYAAAHYLTSKNRSLFLENTEVAWFDLTGSDTEIRLYSGSMSGEILHGDSPLELIERFTEWSGRMPVPPSWLGDGAVVALARPLDESLEIVDGLLAEDARISAVWNQTWSGVNETTIGEQVLWNWTLNKEGWGPFVEDLDDRGIRTLCYVNSMFIVEPPYELDRHLYTEGAELGHFVRDGDGEVLQMPVTAFDVALLDLSSADARDWMRELIQDELVDNAGCSGWMADFAEALPFEAQMADEVSAATWHNRYPVEWARLNREVVEANDGELLVFNRSGHTATPGASTLLWEGDQLTTWDKYDGLVSALHGLISGGFSGIALNHSDIGGYTSLSAGGVGYSREPEQLKRWTEMAAFTAVMRTHEGNQPGENAQIYSDDEAREHFARMTRVYVALGFYREQLFEDAATRGWPVVRHLAMHYPEDPTAWEVDDQFLLGEHILVAPIKNKCWTWPYCPYDKELYLPEGQWVHLWSGEVHEGGRTIVQKAPIGEPAVFYRADWSEISTLKAEFAAQGLEI